ncbi:MAG TPA: DUF86 domain-containing protein [Thermodesulfobacteriota bacterium]|nr:DUF86 domain-containing protein [Thermodesulfobacteriota bacterium]
MTNLSVAENKISSLKKYLSILEPYRNRSVEEIERDTTLRGAIERYLYLVCKTAIDLTEVIISVSKFRKPTTISESFVILEEEGVIGADLKARMADLVALLNVLAHEYEEINYEVLYDVLRNRLQDITEFVETAEKFLNLK